MKTFSREALDLVRALRAAGGDAWIVGGACRDLWLGRDFKDEDIATSLDASIITTRFSGIPTFPGTNVVLFQGKSFEVTTYRREAGTSDHRHPASMSPASALETDAQRRDFTMNAIYSDGVEWRDPLSGREDLAAKLIRAIGVAEERYQEDALRVLRALRFASELDFTIEERTWTALERSVGLVNTVARERIESEMSRLFQGPGASRVLKDYGRVLWAVFPHMSESILDGLPAGVDPCLAGFWLLLGHDDFLRWPLPKEIRQMNQALLRLSLGETNDEREIVSACLAEGEEAVRLHLVLTKGSALSLADLKTRGVPLSRGALALDGHDLQEKGCQGARIRIMQDRLIEAIRAGEAVNTRASLLEWLEKA